MERGILLSIPDFCYAQQIYALNYWLNPHITYDPVCFLKYTHKTSRYNNDLRRKRKQVWG